MTAKLVSELEGRSTKVRSAASKTIRRQRSVGLGIAVLFTALLVLSLARPPRQRLLPEEVTGVLVMTPSGRGLEGLIGAGGRRLAMYDLASMELTALDAKLLALSPQGRWGVTLESEGATLLKNAASAVLIRPRAGGRSRILQPEPLWGGGVVADRWLVFSAGWGQDEFVPFDTADLRWGRPLPQPETTPMPLSWWFASRPDNYYWSTETGNVMHHSQVGDEFIAYGHEPTVAHDGRLAYLTRDRRDIVVADPGGSRSRLRCSRVWKRYPRWSPDGRMIAYCYPHTTFRWGLTARLTDVWGVGILDVATGREYRLLPERAGARHIRGVIDARRLIWVQRPQPDLLKRLCQRGSVQAKPDTAGRR